MDVLPQNLQIVVLLMVKNLHIHWAICFGCKILPHSDACAYALITLTPVAELTF